MSQLSPRIKQELARYADLVKSLQPTVKYEVSGNKSETILELKARGDVARIRQITERVDLSRIDRFR